ncbi:MAG: peptidase dimerization domain-containing protein [Caldilineaceae bacterium]
MAQFLGMMQTLQEREIARHGAHEYLGQPSITPTILRSPCAGEPQKNVMPSTTETVLDFRLIPGQDPDRAIARTETLLKAAAAVDERLHPHMEVLEVRHPTHTPRDEPVVSALASAFTDVTGRAPVYGGVPGSTGRAPSSTRGCAHRHLRAGRHPHPPPRGRVGEHRRDQGGRAHVCAGRHAVSGGARCVTH